MNWIKTSDRLPIPEKRVICVFKHKGLNIISFAEYMYTDDERYKDLSNKFLVLFPFREWTDIKNVPYWANIELPEDLR